MTNADNVQFQPRVALRDPGKQVALRFSLFGQAEVIIENKLNVDSACPTGAEIFWAAWHQLKPGENESINDSQVELKLHKAEARDITLIAATRLTN